MNGFYVYTNDTPCVLFVLDNIVYDFAWGNPSFIRGNFYLEEIEQYENQSCYIKDGMFSRVSQVSRKLTREEVKLCWLMDNRLFDILDEEYRRKL